MFREATEAAQWGEAAGVDVSTGDHIVREHNDRHPYGRYPNLIKGLAIVRPDQVWCGDITNIALPRGFVYSRGAISSLTRHPEYSKIRMMEAATTWTVEYFVDDDGHSPVGEFLSGLDNKTFRRFEWSIEQLRLRNVQAREPLVKHVAGKVWELREESSTNIYRLLYFFYHGRRIVLLHGFAKKTHKLPRKELDIALRRQARFEERKGGDEQ